MTIGKVLCLWLSLYVVSAATPAIGQPTARLEAGQYTLRAETLSRQQRQQIYLRLIENFVGWSEHSARFVDTDELERAPATSTRRGTA